MEHQQFCTEIGKNIRTFRKLQHLTQQELALKLHKSLACVSKYEKGTIALDIYTLYEIANALKISPHLLLPKNLETDWNAPPVPAKLPPTFPASPVYFYCLRTKRPEIITSAIEIHESTLEATLYFDAKDLSDYRKDSYLMFGNIICGETNVRLYFSNPLLSSDFFIIGCHADDLLCGNTIGCGLSLDTNYKFCTSKIFLSQTPVRNPQSLLSVLQMDRDDITRLKKLNYLSL